MAVSSLIPRMRQTLKSKTAPSQPPCNDTNKRSYLYGLRGLLAISGIATTFVRVFIPALAWKVEGAPAYQDVLRIIFSPLLWDDNFISSFYLALSSYSVALRFLSEPSPAAFAGSIVRRVIRLAVSLAIASAIIFGIFSGIGVGQIEKLKNDLPNANIETPEIPPSGLAAANAIFNLFWVTRDYQLQAANAFWPGNTLWNLTAIFNQSWTVYFLMVILPYTRPTWHFEALLLFALGSFWMNSWGWYSAVALLAADYTTNVQLRPRLDQGMTLYKRLASKLPLNLVGVVMIVIGFSLKYTWAALPQYYNKELVLRPYLDLSEHTTIAEYAALGAYPRVDNFLVIFGIILSVQTSVTLKRWLSCNPLMTIGKRSLSIFVAQSIIFWTAGITLYLHLHDDQAVDSPLAKFAVFMVATPATVTLAEVYYRMVDYPSQCLAKEGFGWLLR